MRFASESLSNQPVWSFLDSWDRSQKFRSRSFFTCINGSISIGCSIYVRVTRYVLYPLLVHVPGWALPPVDPLVLTQ
ncbi:hypothetical protein A0H81_05823 [Grifola frondosa]|uniref:Uncharacterized protein n=1 Tax=Grifola frondosa TaxID=5627 RepID=A0A1C7M9F6_GRIFR|nr:hypothetical protein A0H81_05823 [Grifola frondosa]